MSWLSSLFPVFLLVCLPVLAQDLSWLQRQARHRPLRLEDSSLTSLALLDQSADPRGDVFMSLLQPILRPRYVTSPAHEDVRQHIVSVMTSLGWTVDGDRTFRMRTPLGPMPFTNVVATHNPSAPRRLVLACHYDSIYKRDDFVAATDSAVPCAMMLYLAALMTRDYLDPMKGQSDISLQLMFLDGEEAFVRWSDRDSIYGSRRLARELQSSVYQQRPSRGGQENISDLDRIDLFVLLDLLGASNPTISNYITDTNAQFRHLAGVEKRLRRGGLLTKAPNVFRYRKSWGLWGPPQISDDHLPFQRRGVKVLHIIPSPFPSVWHKSSDDASAIHGPTVTNLNRVLRVFVSEYLHHAAIQTV
ncbi:glutaminyl-peptide cyclotransferase-like [Amphibalanus amphitrite]|uniref:glutaminyl-peptide cyclotransferase-like n=1 Tax=Amphibalanus amphitrite TaxID=1232801 RepID=UPI001C8FF1C4|nr:glutaminyl-peptide cyclotransferase-like [Amphibalanus amphitrite]